MDSFVHKLAPRTMHHHDMWVQSTLYAPVSKTVKRLLRYKRLEHLKNATEDLVRWVMLWHRPDTTLFWNSGAIAR